MWLAIAMLLFAPAAARAAQIYWQEPSSRVRAELRLLAAPGEHNQVTVADDGPSHVRVRDAGAPLRAGLSCEPVTPNEVRCPRAAITASLGDGDDTIDLGALQGFVNAGEGDDAIHGSPRGDLLYGDDGADSIDAASGDDEVSGDGGTPTADRLSGGPGSDSIHYTTHPVGVTVTLSQAPVQVGAGAEDLADGFENVSGTFFDDLLIGDDGANRIDAAGGVANRIDARSGDDRVSMLGGFGRLGAGDDRLFAGPRTAVECGRGFDTVQGRRLFGLLQPDCETWPLFVGSHGVVFQVPVAPKVVGRSAVVQFRCPRARVRGRCAGTIVLERSGAPRREIGRRAAAAAPRHDVRAAFPLSRGQRAAARRRAGLGVCIQMRMDYAGDPRGPEWDGYCTTLRAR